MAINYWCVEFAGQGFGSVCGGAGLQGQLLETPLEALPMSDPANASWLQDGPAAGHGKPISDSPCELNIINKRGKTCATAA